MFIGGITDERTSKGTRLSNETISDKALSPGEAATLLSINPRQCRRLYQCWRQFGDSGLVSGHRGRASNHRQDEMRATFISWYSGLHPHGRYHRKPASDCFHEETGIRVSSDKYSSLVIGRRLLAVEAKESIVASSSPRPSSKTRRVDPDRWF